MLLLDPTQSPISGTAAWETTAPLNPPHPVGGKCMGCWDFMKPSLHIHICKMRMFYSFVKIIYGFVYKTHEGAVEIFKRIGSELFQISQKTSRVKWALQIRWKQRVAHSYAKAPNPDKMWVGKWSQSPTFYQPLIHTFHPL